MLCGMLSLWSPSVTPPTPEPPAPAPIIEEYRTGTSPVLFPTIKINYTNYPPGYEFPIDIEQQNADDLEIVKVLTEFLNRN